MPQRMTPKERILAAARHQEPDLVPVSPMVFPFLRRHYGGRSWEYEIKAAQDFDFDPIVHMICFDGSPVHNNIRFLNGNYVYEGRAYFEDMSPGIRIDLQVERLENSTLVSRVIHTPAGKLQDVVRQPLITNARYSGSTIFEDIRGYWGPPERLERLVKGPEDLEKVAFLLTKPTLAELASIGRITELIGERGLFQVDVMSPLDEFAEYAIGINELVNSYRTNRRFFDAVVGLFWRHSMELTVAYLEAGAESLNACWIACGESSGWTFQEFREVFLPLLREHVELAHEYGAIYDYLEEGKLHNFLPMLMEAGVDVVHTLAPPPVGDVDLAEAKRLIGDQVCLRGNVDSEGVLLKGTPKEVEMSVHEAVVTAAHGGGFILGCSDTLSADMPIENIRAFFHAGRKYGDYNHLGREA